MKHAFIDKGSRKIVTLFAKKSGYFSPKIGGGEMCQNPFQAILRKELFCGFPITRYI